MTARAPTDEEAIAALQRVQALSPAEFERALEEDVGAPMVSLFHALARAMHPHDDDDAIAKKLHLMMLAWLMARTPAGASGSAEP